MDTLKPLRTLQIKLLQLVSTIGIVASACITLMLMLALLITLKLGSIHSQHNQELVDLSNDQTLLSSNFLGTIDDIDLAIRTQDWDSIKPASQALTEQFNQWITTHEQLSTKSTNTKILAPTGLTVADHFDRLAYNKTQIQSAVSELQIVTTSIVRRAPYISQSSQSRVFASAESIRDQIPIYMDSIEQINTIYTAHATQQRNNSIASIQRLCVFMLLGLLILPIIAIAPKIRSMESNEQSIRNELIDAQAAASHRWSLLASLGHEFRNPMSSIIGFASLLINEQQDQQTKIEHAQRIHNASTGLNTLIEDILQISSIEAGTLRIDPSHTDIHTLMNSLESRFSPVASSKGLQFKTHLDESCPVSITTDEHHLNLLLEKLVDNAIQYTNTGSVDIHASLEQHQGQDQFTIRIVDTGIGINHDLIPRIFDPFSRIGPGSSREQHGNGLGLTLARALARQLGGDIAIESAPGAGCFVTVIIDPGAYSFAQSTQPTSQPQSQPTQEDQSHNPDHPDQSAQLDQSAQIDHAILSAKHVLIVEDGEDNQRLLSHFMTKAGCTVQLANNGQEGVDRVLGAQKTNAPFELILMDMQMPVLDGFEATAIIREEGISTPIIGVTAFTTNDDRTRCLQAGCDAYLPKPLSKADLLDTCAKQLHLYEQQTPDQAA